MQINNVSTVSCKGLNQTRIPLKNGKDAIIKLSDEAFDCIFMENGRMVGGKGYYSPKGVDQNKFFNLLDDLKKNAKEGFEFLADFMKAIYKA